MQGLAGGIRPATVGYLKTNVEIARGELVYGVFVGGGGPVAEIPVILGRLEG